MRTDDEIPAYFWLATVSAVLCCPFTGIPALAQSARVKALLERGDLEAAREASQRTRKLVVYSFVLGFLLVTGTIAIALGAGLYLREWLIRKAESGGI